MMTAKGSFLSILDAGTLYHVVSLVCVGGGQPSSLRCLKEFVNDWASWAGWPRIVVTDRGLHNRGAFSRGIAANGVLHRQAGLATPAHLGRAERHGGLIKRNLKRIIRDHHVVGKANIKLAAAEAQIAKNELVRHGGFAPVQWVLGRFPRVLGRTLDDEELGHLGVLHAQGDPRRTLVPGHTNG